jgi:hypothetical protein
VLAPPKEQLPTLAQNYGNMQMISSKRQGYNQCSPSMKQHLVSTIMVEVEDHKKSIQENIQNLIQFEEKSIEEHLLKPARLTHKIQSFVKATSEQLYQEVSAKVCNGESVLERLQSRKLESILSDHSIWKEYQDQL